MITPLYQPLDAARRQIRLIYIDPHGEPNRISCFIRTFDLAKAPIYKTLSYEWGPADEQRTIHVNHHEVKIRRNLFEFLLVHKKRCQPGGAHYYTHQPFPDRPTERTLNKLPPIWIDQLCIDQSNRVERSQQVDMMPEIYCKSGETLAWLGCAMIADASESLLSGHDQLHNDIIAASYWKRHWIAQEIALSEVVTILHQSQVLDTLSFTQLFIGIAQSHANVPLRLLLWMAWTAKRNIDQVTPFVAVSVCVDPRDKVYRIQGILEPRYRVPVDYALTARGLFILTAEKWFESLCVRPFALLLSLAELAMGMGLCETCSTVDQDWKAQLLTYVYICYKESGLMATTECSREDMRDFIHNYLLAPRSESTIE